MINVDIDKLNAFMADKDLVDEMMMQETPEAAQAFFAQHGVELTLEEVNEIGKNFAQIIANGGELSEEDLDVVAGGALAAAWAIAKLVIGIGSAGLACYKWYKSAH